MPLSAALQTRYTTEVNIDWVNAIILSHSLFTSTYYITAHAVAHQGKVDGVTHDFVPIPFQIQLPRRDGQGQQDLGLSICNIGKEVYNAVQAASAKPNEQIRCRYTIYILGNLDPQIDPMLDLSLTNISINDLAVSATATRAQLFNLPFPALRYRPDLFPGLNRR